MKREAVNELTQTARDARRALGKCCREVAPRIAHANWKPQSERVNIVERIEQSNRDRLPELIPIRVGRMMQSPLATFRGLAAMMAHDLQQCPRTDITIESCGDSHLQNFGWFGTPERHLIFDLTDFDETIEAPWEWDLKRLVVSVVLASLGMGESRTYQHHIARTVTHSYRKHLAEYEPLSPLAMWYQRIDADVLIQKAADADARSRYQRKVEKAHERTIEEMLPRLTHRTANTWRITDLDPVIFHPPQSDQYLHEMGRILSGYRTTLSDDRRSLLDRYRLVDAAYKVVGVGSVGLRCGVLLLLDVDEFPLVLQVKEARSSVWEPFVGPHAARHHGQRIVAGQRIMQAASDLFLGWSSDTAGREYYVRQLRDMKLSIEVVNLSRLDLEDDAYLCGWALARAHAKVGDTSRILGYIGSGEELDGAFGDFAVSYADQVQRDFEMLVKAVRMGRLPAEANV